MHTKGMVQLWSNNEIHLTETRRLFSFSILNKFIRIHASVNFVEKQTFQFHNSWKRYFYSQIFNNVCKLKHVHLKYLAKRHISLKVRTWIILHIIVDKSVHLGNLQHAGWFKIVQADKWVCEDLQNDFVKYFFVHVFFLMLSSSLDLNGIIKNINEQSNM